MAAITSHQLALEIPEQSCPDILRIWDSSVYADNILVECETLEILIPGYTTVVKFENDGTSLQFSAWTFKVATTSTGADATVATTTTATFSLTSYTDVVIGQYVTGTGVPDGAIVTDVNGTTDITIVYPAVSPAPALADFNAIQDLRFFDYVEDTTGYAVNGVPFMKNFDLRLSAVDLGLQMAGQDDLACLPDGTYTLQYSVSPNDVKYVKYYHLRMVKALNEYYKELCTLQLAECEPTAEVKQKLADLRYIKMLYDSAKSKTEYCHAPEQGLAMYQYANKLMKKYQDGCCVTCV
jgi:hypothetical protein